MRGATIPWVLLLAACDRGVPSEVTLRASVTATTTASVTATTTASGPRRLVWRQGDTLTLDRDGIAGLRDAERAAVAYLATTIGSNCEWTRAPTADGQAGSMRCALTDALGLGEQCGEKHRVLVMGWLGDDAPSSCAKIPTTAFSQTTFDELRLSHDGREIVVSYAAVHTDGPGGSTAAWSETIVFAPRGDHGLRIESRRVTKGARPK